MTSPLLDVRDLRVDFATPQGPVTALDGVTFGIAAGELLGVVGESGAGKSLTGAAVLGLLPPPGRVAGGCILFDGERIDNLVPSAYRRLRGAQIGAIFQDPLAALDPLFTIGQQLVETLRTHLPLSAREARQRAIALLAETGIPGAAQRIDQYPHQFSGGMRQRAVIAMALAGEPRLLIADEPTTALDVSVQAQIIDLLHRLARERGVAVMLVTHDIGVVAQACDRVAVMYAGRLVEVGPVEQVLSAPAHPYTRGLLAAIPSTAGDTPRLEQIPGAMPRPGTLPSGCAFHPRCPHAFDTCVRQRPSLLPVGEAFAACWLQSREVPAWPR